MSFYLGSNSIGNKVLHMTKSVNTVEELKSGVLTNTIFHSDLNYVTAKKYTGTILNGMLTIDESLRAELNTRIWIIVSASGAFINPYIQYDEYSGVSYGTWLTATTMRLAANSGPVWTYLGSSYVPKFAWRSAPILDSTHNGECEIFTFSASETSFYPSVKLNNEIKVGQGIINIGGVDLTNVGYISRGILNNIDPQFTIQGIPIQITNVNFTASDSLEIISNSAVSLISRAAQPIIHSILGHSMEYKYTTTAYSPANSGIYGNYTTVEYKTNFSSPVSDNAFIVMSFPNGTILGNKDGYNSTLIPINIDFICFRFVSGKLGGTLIHHLLYIKADNTGITIKNSFLVYGAVSYTGEYFTYHLFD